MNYQQLARELGYQWLDSDGSGQWICFRPLELAGEPILYRPREEAIKRFHELAKRFSRD